DPAGDDDGGQGERQQAEFDADARDLEEIAQREKVLRDRRKKCDLAGQRHEQNRHRGQTGVRPHRRCVKIVTPSAATAARMIAPCSARSQYALAPRNVSAGPIAPSRTTPRSVPTRVPLPPVIAAPPTTTEAMTFISSPRPALLGIWLKRTEFSSAASP